MIFLKQNQARYLWSYPYIASWDAPGSITTPFIYSFKHSRPLLPTKPLTEANQVEATATFISERIYRVEEGFRLRNIIELQIECLKLQNRNKQVTSVKTMGHKSQIIDVFTARFSWPVLPLLAT